jgi:hypothetical protein
MDSGMSRATFLAWVQVPSTTIILNPERLLAESKKEATKHKATNLQVSQLVKTIDQQRILAILRVRSAQMRPA